MSLKKMMGIVTVVCAMSFSVVAYDESEIEKVGSFYVNKSQLMSARESRELVIADAEKKSVSSKSNCVILSHTDYTASVGTACVQCGNTLVSVGWWPSNGFDYSPRQYWGNVVSSC